MSKSLSSAASNLSRSKRLAWTFVSLVFCLVMIFYGGEPTGAAGGDQDTSFDHGRGAHDTLYPTDVQSDGKIISGGKITSDHGTSREHIAGRLSAPGAVSFSSASYEVDETVGTATITLTRTGGTDNKVVAKVTVADVTTSPADYSVSGSLDTSFNTGGAGASNPVYAVAMQPDGKIIIGGTFTSYNGDSAASDYIARLNSDGTLDTSFNPGGTGAQGFVNAVAVQADGKIIIGGSFTGYNDDSDASDYIARLNSDGTLDPTFNPGGTGANDWINAVAVQADGKIIIGGNFTSYNGGLNATDYIARLNSDGTLDTSFNPGGMGAESFVYAVTMQPDGKILIGGIFIGYNGDSTASDSIARLNSDGTLDTSFNPDAIGANGQVSAIAVQVDGKIIIGGTFTSYNNDSAASDYIARLNSDGTLDTSFNPGGTGMDNYVWAVAVQSDGKILIGGDFNTYNGDFGAGSYYIARLNSNGMLDPTFNPNGSGASNSVVAIALQEDSKIIIGGYFLNYGGDSAASDRIIRLCGDTFFVTWPAGDATNKTIGLPIVKDGINEPDESLTLSLTVISGGATLGSPDTATLTIFDANDAPVNTVPATQATNENTARVFSSANSNQISIADIDAGTNPVRVTLTATHGTLTLNGTSGLSFITGDGTNDEMMSFMGTITNINAALNGLSFNPAANYSGVATLQIVTNDLGNTGTGSAQSDTDTVNIKVNEGGVLKLSATTYSANEATSTITVTRTGGSAGVASLQYNTSNGTATGGPTCAAGIDYQTVTGTLSWADGDAASKTFTVPICNDATYEGNETVKLGLSNATGSASLGTPLAAVLTIVDNETKPKLSINNITVTEGNAGTVKANFTVMLSGAGSRTVTVKYATVNGTATAPADYTATPLTVLTFAPGQTSKRVTVAVNGDRLDEINEAFKVVLSSPTNASIAVGQGACTITDNDPTPSLRINNATVTEGNAGTSVATFTVSLSAASGQTVTVKYATANGTATAPADYTAIGQTTLTFSPGQITKTLKVMVKGETLGEANETFFVNLSGAVNATIVDAQGQGAIINDD